MKKRIVLTYHGGGGEKFFDKHPKLVRHFLTRTNANIVLSGFLAKVFEQHHIPFVTIPNIIELDDTLFHLREQLKPNYICTRAHEPLYNIPCILHAFQKVQAEHPEATLTLVGGGSEHDNLIKMSEELGLQNITFTGKVDNKEIYKYLAQADILLSSPTIDNMPVSLLEAMNAGLLVISSKVGGVTYMIQNNNTGLLFLAKKDYALAKYYFEEAKRQGSNDADANIPILNLKRGNYSEAQKAMKGNPCTYNLAFAQLMNDETGTAVRTLDCCLDQNADVKYLRAVCYARLGDKTNCLKNLKASIDDNYEYKRKAAVDTEFKDYWDDPEFKLIIKLYNN